MSGYNSGREGREIQLVVNSLVAHMFALVSSWLLSLDLWGKTEKRKIILEAYRTALFHGHNSEYKHDLCYTQFMIDKTDLNFQNLAN